MAIGVIIGVELAIVVFQVVLQNKTTLQKVLNVDRTTTKPTGEVIMPEGGELQDWIDSLKSE